MSYDNKEEAEQMIKEIMEGRHTLPPNGSVMGAYLEADKGPPMMRMIVMQVVFAIAGKARIASMKAKIMIILMIISFFIVKDLNTFLTLRQPNIY
jgi:hypothetical protein